MPQSKLKPYKHKYLQTKTSSITLTIKNYTLRQEEHTNPLPTPNATVEKQKIKCRSPQHLSIVVDPMP